jgi:hypothetical protein
VNYTTTPRSSFSLSSTRWLPTSRKAIRIPSFRFRASCLLVLALVSSAVCQTDPYPYNAISCERCHSIPTKFGSSSTTVQRKGTGLDGKFVPALEGGIHHRNGESAQSSALANEITGERVSFNLLGDGYIEAVDSRDIEQNAQRQHQSNLGIAGVVVSAPVLEARGTSIKMQV